MTYQKVKTCYIFTFFSVVLQPVFGSSTPLRGLFDSSHTYVLPDSECQALGYSINQHGTTAQIEPWPLHCQSLNPQYKVHPRDVWSEYLHSEKSIQLHGSESAYLGSRGEDMYIIENGQNI